MKGATNPQSFDRIVREVFAPIYPVIAEQIKKVTAITEGRCLDAGCGTGALGIAMAKITDLHITFLDQSEEMLDLVFGHTFANNLLERSALVCGDIHAIPLPDEDIHLVISRGSSPFWDDWHKAYSEILRILKPGGMVYIGGGFGNAQLREKIIAKIVFSLNAKPCRKFLHRSNPQNIRSSTTKAAFGPLLPNRGIS